MQTLLRNACAALGAAILTASSAASATTVLPVFDPANFKPGAAVDNTFLPFKPGTLSILRGSFVDNGQTVTEELQRRVMSGRVSIGGVDATVVRDRAIIDGVLVEDTFDYFAQDKVGNVWYLGEDVTNYVYDANGNLISTNNKSAWRTGVNGALPGFGMPSTILLGFEYFQEHAPADGALDIGFTYAKDQTIATVLGQLSGVQMVFETSPLDATLREFKYYAPGLGLVRVDEELDSAFKPRFSLELVSISTVPEPGVWSMMIGGFAIAGAALRQRRRLQALTL